MPNGGVGAHEEVGGGVCQGFVASMSDKGGRAWRWKSVGLMVWYLWLPTYCPYRRLSVCVIPTYVHLGDDRNSLEMVKWLRGLLSHLAMYERWRRIVVMDLHVHYT